MAVFRDFYRVARRAFFAFAVCFFSVFCCNDFAMAGEETSTFGLIIVANPDKPFFFSLAATGTFYVNCGGGTLEIHGEEDGITMAPFSEGVIEIVSGTTDPRRFGCSYDGNGKKNIYFGGLATSYNGEYQNAAISFYDEEYQENTANIDTISGDLSAIFPYNVENETHPTFYKTFYGASNARAIPSTLFSEYTAGTSHMFASTFEGCSTLTTLPNELFSNIGTGAENMFESTFKDCTGLTELPDTLFSKVETGADNMFESTFAGCSTMKGTVPASLFEKLIENKSDATELMKGIFEGTALDTLCSADYYQFETGYEEYWGTGNGESAVVCESCPAGTHSAAGAKSVQDCRSTNVPSLYTVTYNCNGGGVGFYQSVTEGTYIDADANTLSNVANCVAPSGYEFAGWYCSYGSNNVNLSTLVSILNVNTNGVMVHENLACSGVSCGFNISANTDCVVLWRTVNSCANNGTSTQYVLGNPASQFTSAMWNESGTNTDTYYAQDTNVFPSYGSIIYERRCSTTGGVVGMSGSPSTSGGVNCWCRVKEYQPLNASSPTTMNDTPWVFVGKSDSYNACQNEGSIGGAEPGCMHACSKNAQSGSLLPVLYSTYQCQYNVTYNCGSNSSYIGSGNYAGVNPWQFSSGQTVNTSGATCSSVSGYSFSGWNCGGGIGTLAANATFSMPSSNVTCTAQWTANAPSRYDITYDCNGGQWYSNGAQHTFIYQTSTVALTDNTGNNQSNPAMCVYSGKNFLGWTCLTNVDNYSAYVNGDSNWQYTFPTINGATSATCYATWGTTKPCMPGTINKNSPEILGVFVGEHANDMDYEWKNEITLDELFYPASMNIGVNMSFADPDGNQWTVTLDNGLCSPTAGIPYNAGTPVESPSGNFCWCRVRGVNGTNLTGYPWVFSGTQLPNCTSNQCTGWCMEIIGALQKESDIRTLLSSLYTKISCAYSINYNCGNLPTAATVNGTPPTTQSGIDPNTQAQLASSAPNCNATGYDFGGWKCYASADTNLTNSLAISNNAITMPEDNVMCYATWNPGTTYSLTYNCNNGNAGGTAPTDSNSPYLYGATNINLAQNAGSCNAPANKAFNGWSCHKSGDASVPVGANGVIASMPAYDVVCDAQWDNVYTLTYNCNNNGAGTTPTDTNGPYFAGDSVYILQNQSTCTSPGMNFSGWNCHKANDSSVTAFTTTPYTMPAYDVVCDAGWIRTLVYNCGSGSAITNSGYNITTGAPSVTLADNDTLCTPPNGYTFYKWACRESVNGVFYEEMYDPGEVYSFASNNPVFCLAFYKETLPCAPENNAAYVLGQSLSAGAVSNDNSVWGQNWPITLGNLWNSYTSSSFSGNTATFSYSSNSWTVGVSGRCSNTYWGTSGETGHPSTTPGNHCWCQVNTVTVNGSTAPLSDYPWVYVSIIDPGCDSSCANVCAQWATDATGYHGEAQEFFLQSLYTKDRCTFSLTYDCNNGVSGQSSIVDNGNLESGDTVTLWHDLGTGFVGDGVNHSNLCTVPDNSTFAGWSCTNVTVNNNTITMPSNNVVCTAQWTSNAPTQYTLTYDCNGGTQIDQNTQMVYTYEPNQNYDILGVSTLCQRTGYAPDPNGTNVAYSWICQADDDPNEYLTYVHAVWIYTHNYTCRAQWKLVNYTLTYSVPTLSGVTINNAPSSSAVVMTMGTIYPLEPLPTATGYTASAWNCTYSGNTALTPDSDNQITMPAANVICSTTWTPNTIGLSWNPNGGTPVSVVTPNSCIYMSLAGQSGGINNIVHPTKTGYTFNGWLLTGWDECGLKSAVDVGAASNGRYIYKDIENEVHTNGWDYKLTGDQTWAAGFPYGAIAGVSACSVEDSTSLSNAEPEAGPVCWCRITSFIPTNGPRCDLIYTQIWQSSHIFGDPSECEINCAQSCVDEIILQADFRKKMYGTE